MCKKHQAVKGGGGMNWETGVDTFTLLLLWIKQISNEKLLHSTGNSTQRSVVN